MNKFHHLIITYIMEAQLSSHEEISAAIEKKPHLFNALTQNYLQYLKSSSYTPDTASWEALQSVLKQMNQKDTPLYVCALLFNVAKLVLNETLGSTSGVKDNKIYCWMSMLYGVKCGEIIQKMQNISRILEQAGQDDQKFNDEAILLKLIGIALLLSQIIISLNQKVNRMNTSNRVIYPQFYRLMNYSIQCLAKFIKPNVDHTLSTNSQSVDQQSKQAHRIQIKTTEILKGIHLGKVKAAKEKGDNKLSYINHRALSASATGKIIELISRSFDICRCKSMKQMHIIKQSINNLLKELIQSQDENSNKRNHRNTESTLKTIISGYLQMFKEREHLDSPNMQQQIDEDNKIIQVKELTPRFADDGPVMELKKLRMKKKKLIKKIESDSRTATLNRLQEQKVVQDVRSQRASRRQKKEIFIMQKQTEQAKKQHNKMKRVKLIQKQGNKGKGNNKNMKNIKNIKNTRNMKNSRSNGKFKKGNK